ncbi:hypothetical protein BGY98DRAFT_947874 [Russula aff. rugulosa BPL654]|nr:hypothetical protein BGY98DRAFT_947874 [Russula aff. rugulosa BPL654]
MTTEEDLLQEEYRGNRQSRQLHLGYSIYQQGSHWERGRGKVTRALSKVGRNVRRGFRRLKDMITK